MSGAGGPDRRRVEILERRRLHDGFYQLDRLVLRHRHADQSPRPLQDVSSTRPQPRRSRNEPEAARGKGGARIGTRLVHQKLRRAGCALTW